MATNIQINTLRSERCGEMADSLSSHHCNDDEDVINDMQLDRTNTSH